MATCAQRADRRDSPLSLERTALGLDSAKESEMECGADIFDPAVHTVRPLGGIPPTRIFPDQ